MFKKEKFIQTNCTIAQRSSEYRLPTQEPKKAFLIRYPKDSSVSNFAVKKKKKKKLGKEKMKAERINNEKLQKMLNDLNLSSYTRPSHSSYRALI
jgi:hypothetical protein